MFKVELAKNIQDLKSSEELEKLEKIEKIQEEARQLKIKEIKRMKKEIQAKIEGFNVNEEFFAGPPPGIKETVEVFYFVLRYHIVLGFSKR